MSSLTRAAATAGVNVATNPFCHPEGAKKERDDAEREEKGAQVWVSRGWQGVAGGGKGVETWGVARGAWSVELVEVRLR